MHLLICSVKCHSLSGTNELVMIFRNFVTGNDFVHLFDLFWHHIIFALKVGDFIMTSGDVHDRR